MPRQIEIDLFPGDSEDKNVPSADSDLFGSSDISSGQSMKLEQENKDKKAVITAHVTDNRNDLFEDD